MTPEIQRLYAAADIESAIRTDERERCAKVIKKRANDYHKEHGHQEYDTGVWKYPGNGYDFMCEWLELEESILAIAPAPPSTMTPEIQRLYAAARFANELRGHGVIIVNPTEHTSAQQAAVTVLGDLAEALAALDTPTLEKPHE